MNKPQKNCFVVMPITDPTGYEQGHFSRVYEHLIRPACEAAGFEPTRADDVKSTNYIVLDILQRIVRSDLVICDLSSRNPNVMYELGIRQAFNLPVVLLKDKRTDRVFDIQGLRTFDYDESLRIDCIRRDVEQLRSSIVSTSDPLPHDVNSLVKLLGVSSAVLPNKADVSSDTAMLLAALNEISQRLTRVEETSFKKSIVRTAPSKDFLSSIKPRKFKLPNGENVEVGDTIFDHSGGDTLGTLIAVEKDAVLIDKGDGLLVISVDDAHYSTLSQIPF